LARVRFHALRPAKRAWRVAIVAAATLAWPTFARCREQRPWSADAPLIAPEMQPARKGDEQLPGQAVPVSGGADLYLYASFPKSPLSTSTLVLRARRSENDRRSSPRRASARVPRLLSARPACAPSMVGGVGRSQQRRQQERCEKLGGQSGAVSQGAGGRRRVASHAIPRPPRRGVGAGASVGSPDAARRPRERRVSMGTLGECVHENGLACTTT
jgi:hypothetical protein